MTMTEPLLPDHLYHIYNRGNNRENIFAEARNYPYFLTLYLHHVAPVADLLAYCLLKNHFHLLICLKEREHWPRDPSRCFSNMFNAYARAFNRVQGRTGALFQRPFKRKCIVDERQRNATVVYIHRNPQNHGFVDDFRDWPYSSYHGLSGARPTRLPRELVLSWFGGQESFVSAHECIGLSGAAQD